MVRFLLSTFVLLLCSKVMLAQTILTGQVIDEATKDALIGASVKVTKGGETVRGAITDFDGNYRITLDPGKYDVSVIYTGYQTQQLSGVQVLSNNLNKQDFKLSQGALLQEVVISQYKVPLIKQDETSTGQQLTSEQIAKMPTRSVQQIVATTAGTTSIDGGDINIKGSRSNATNYYIDGIRVSGSPPPVQDLEQLQVITGGLGAEYGDVTGGVISLITKGPAAKYHGSVEIENSHGLDNFGWLLGTANVSGPILRKKLENGATRTIVGFRLSGQYLTQKDDSPPAVAIYRPKQSVLDNLSENPLKQENGILINAAEQLTKDSVETMKYRPNEGRQDIDLTTKLDFRLTDNMDFSVTGTYKNTENQFTPDPLNQGRPTGRLLNAQNNPTRYNNRYRGLARFRHRLGSSDPSKDASSRAVSISNASYQIQFGYELENETEYDPRHKDRYFDYGYIGRFNFLDSAIVNGNNLDGYEHVGYLPYFVNFEAGYKDGENNVVIPNQGLNNYNKFAKNLTAESAADYTSYRFRNGIFDQQYNDIWGNMHSNINQVYNRFNKNRTDLITIMASSSFDLKLGRSGVHNIQFGLMNEQRIQRNYTLNPFAIWNLMEQTANLHFNGLDTSKIIGQIETPLGFTPKYAHLTIDLPDNKFYREVRKSLNNRPNDLFVNTNELAPSFFNLGMFSPRELTDFQILGYYGYDHTGKEVGTNITFNDFFRSRDAEGIRNFPVAPLQPLYQAAYFKDKFTFNKIIFSLGMRVERFDLNTKVMRDQYSLYQIKNARDYHAANPGTRPGTVGDDFKVYIKSNNDPSVIGYRDGDVWYDKEGRQANDGFAVFGSSPIQPLYADTVNGDDIFNPNFNPDLSFEDYKPQINWLPRLAFSFPISEDANFFAHYDILVQRPQDGSWQVTPLNYLYFNTSGRTPVNNANLRPERVVDYEVGFQQRLTQNSALKFSMYYREMRDMIQRRTIAFVPDIVRYETFGNIDFSTVKGFTMQYDLRRIQNTELRLAYTLQFADGTGSDQNSQRGLTARGNIRTLFPLNFDERHNVSGIIDYRFDEGKRYNGPTLGGKDILSNFGVNLQLIAASGRPFTSRIRPTPFGGEGTVGALNGNRKPWRLTLDMRVDKTLHLSAPGKNPLDLNIYLRVSNLLNRQNVLDVYPVTGSATDDGYLASAEGRGIIQDVANRGRNAQSYIDSYSWALLDAGNFSLPRRIYVGAALSF
jgi:outer membrane receptor protein involved in Fe transport